MFFCSFLCSRYPIVQFGEGLADFAFGVDVFCRLLLWHLAALFQHPGGKLPSIWQCVLQAGSCPIGVPSTVAAKSGLEASKSGRADDREIPVLDQKVLSRLFSSLDILEDLGVPGSMASGRSTLSQNESPLLNISFPWFPADFWLGKRMVITNFSIHFN